MTCARDWFDTPSARAMVRLVRLGERPEFLLIFLGIAIVALARSLCR